MVYTFNELSFLPSFIEILDEQLFDFWLTIAYCSILPLEQTYIWRKWPDDSRTWCRIDLPRKPRLEPVGYYYSSYFRDDFARSNSSKGTNISIFLKS